MSHAWQLPTGGAACESCLQRWCRSAFLRGCLAGVGYTCDLADLFLPRAQAGGTLVDVGRSMIYCSTDSCPSIQNEMKERREAWSAGPGVFFCAPAGVRAKRSAQSCGQRGEPVVYLLIAIFILSLVIALGAAAWFTRCLEVLSDALRFSPGLLSLLGALGAISGQVGVIIGSNIYNVAIIPGLSTFAVPARRGITLARTEARDASLVGMVALAGHDAHHSSGCRRSDMAGCAPGFCAGLLAPADLQCADAWTFRRARSPRPAARTCPRSVGVWSHSANVSAWEARGAQLVKPWLRWLCICQKRS